MNIEDNLARLNKIDEDNSVQNLFAQANSRYILFNTFENAENFPAFTVNDNSLNILAFYYLEIGCSFAENQNLELARIPLEKGALLLENIHGSNTNKNYLSDYYLLISAMSYYAAFQYSKAFILIKKAESSTAIGSLVSKFLSRSYDFLNQKIAEIIVAPIYSDDNISQNEDEIDGADRVYEITIAKSLNGFIKYFQTGDTTLLSQAQENLRLLKEIAEIRSEPSVWWVIRLLIIISDGFIEASLWSSLGMYFDLNNSIIDKYIKSLVYLNPRNIFELFITQRKSLVKVLDKNESSCVVTIPTSSGKTRIAEISIVNSLINKPNCKILYLAPFRSLAFEVENALEAVLSKVGFSISQLYGGSLFSQLDQKIIDESNVIIATPEKAKAMLRSNPALADEISLIIIDEGHLLGPDKRLIVNEIFYEELRSIAEINGAKFLVLSAVLPNSNDLALWLANDKDAVFKDNWRPSDERLGILEWTGSQVNLEWINNDIERRSFNNRFINPISIPLVGKQRTPRFHPSDKNEAVAATAYKLKNFGTSLIFVGVKSSVFVMAEAYLKCLDKAASFTYKDEMDWKAYELACIETYGANNEWLKYAKKGILCHHGSLLTDVRLPLERLMRSSPPLVIISTSTLGQGVNLGVSTVIFSTLNQAGPEITPRDFWNIAGRAGRAFIDHEGKILVSIDTSDNSRLFSGIKKSRNTKPAFYHRARRENTIRQIEKIKKYFDKDKIDLAQSGILALIKALKDIAVQSEVDFDLLIQLISENNIQEFGTNAKEIDDTLDWIDDTLLSLHNLNSPQGDDNNYQWVDSFFRKSLAYIQITPDSSLTTEEIISFMEARVKGIVKKVGNDRNKWLSIIKSGIPLNSDLFIESRLTDLISLVQTYLDLEDGSVPNKIDLIRKFIPLIEDIPVLTEKVTSLNSVNFDKLLDGWINASPISNLLSFNNAEKIISDYFSFVLPWVFNGIAKKMRNLELDSHAEIVEEISMLIEIGLPSLKAIKIYQAGIRSRVSALELSSLFEDEFWDKSIQDYKTDILENQEAYKLLVSEYCGEWIDMLLQATNAKTKTIKCVPNFTYDVDTNDILIAKEINGEQHLVSPDLSSVYNINDTTIDFSFVNKLQGIYFKFDKVSEVWKMIVDNPHIMVSSN